MACFIFQQYDKMKCLFFFISTDSLVRKLTTCSSQELISAIGQFSSISTELDCTTAREYDVWLTVRPDANTLCMQEHCSNPSICFSRVAISALFSALSFNNFSIRPRRCSCFLCPRYVFSKICYSLG